MVEMDHETQLDKDKIALELLKTKNDKEKDGIFLNLRSDSQVLDQKEKQLQCEVLG